MSVFLRVIVVVASIGCAAAQTQPLSVCQVLDSARDHQEVIVRARAFAHYHGSLLTDGFSSDPCPGWRKRFFTAPSWIPLCFDSFLGVQLTGEQQRLNREFFLRLSGLRMGSPSKYSAVTLMGVAVRKPWPLIFRRGDGEYFGNAMGQNGAFPVVFVLSDVLEESEGRPVRQP
jgi:hypothetical protein